MLKTALKPIAGLVKPKKDITSNFFLHFKLQIRSNHDYEIHEHVLVIDFSVKIEWEWEKERQVNNTTDRERAFYLAG